MKVSIGRPTKKRRREHDEPKTSSRLRRRYPKIKCGKCGGLGHNKRGCHNPAISQPPNVNVNVDIESAVGRRGTKGRGRGRGGRKVGPMRGGGIGRSSTTNTDAVSIDADRVNSGNVFRSKMPMKRSMMRGGGSGGGIVMTESHTMPMDLSFGGSCSPGKRTKSSARRMPNTILTIQGATSKARYTTMLNATQESITKARR
ncbi:uncharacterized protein LOC119983821 [Tripterygium wilfordii]|uniref:uncharacterized protein LOC119983821 n=1 Tax=Tripterygium wilfordii TaxID=458696 RepID=UPI0018F80DD1|nr:uncharacterized protein LOC119983821 [Tripterygium wilfordii]